MDNIKDKMHWWPAAGLRSHCDEIVEQNSRELPEYSLLLHLFGEYSIDTRELEHLITADADL